jgi:hypothetical protein
MKRVIVCGGRDYSDALRVDQVLSKVWRKHPDAELVEGGARGADRLARQWADENGFNVLTVEAEWDRLGKSAGYKRNEAMAELDGVIGVVAFPGGVGTAHMIKIAESRKIPVYVVK